jgi:hypothetical protein
LPVSEVRDKKEEELLSRLRQGLEATDPAPADVTEFAQAAFGWRDIDAKLAEVAFDSSLEETPAGVRSTATARMLSFEAGTWTIEIEHNASTGRLIGQIDPIRETLVELHFAGGEMTTEVDDLGRFVFDGVRSGPASLVLRTSGDLEVVKTEWTVL